VAQSAGACAALHQSAPCLRSSALDQKKNGVDISKRTDIRDRTNRCKEGLLPLFLTRRRAERCLLMSHRAELSIGWNGCLAPAMQFLWPATRGIDPLPFLAMSSFSLYISKKLPS